MVKRLNRPARPHLRRSPPVLAGLSRLFAPGENRGQGGTVVADYRELFEAIRIHP